MKLEIGLARVKAGKDDLREKIATKHEETIEDLNQDLGNTKRQIYPYLDKVITGQIETAKRVREEQKKTLKGKRKG